MVRLFFRSPSTLRSSIRAIHVPWIVFKCVFTDKGIWRSAFFTSEKLFPASFSRCWSADRPSSFYTLSFGLSGKLLRLPASYSALFDPIVIFTNLLSFITALIRFWSPDL